MEVQNKENISLGGNIDLNGFQNIEPAKLVVLKKIIGNCAKQMKEKKPDYEKLVMTLEGEDKIKAELTAGGKTITGESEPTNLFMAVDQALKKVMEQL